MITLVRFKKPVVIDGTPISSVREQHAGNNKILQITKEDGCIVISTESRSTFVPLNNVESWDEE